MFSYTDSAETCRKKRHVSALGACGNGKWRADEECVAHVNAKPQLFVILWKGLNYLWSLNKSKWNIVLDSLEFSKSYWDRFQIMQ